MSDVVVNDRAALSREFSELLLELSIALHKFGMYPAAHPALVPVTEGVVARASQLLVDRTQIVFGVARRQLVIEGIATSESHPVLRRLAEGLHGHQLGAVSLHRGLQRQEVAEALEALARDPEQGGALGRAPAGTRLAWPHLRLHPLSFDGLSLSTAAPETAAPGAGGGLRGAELWIGLARAAMSGDELPGGGVATDDEDDTATRAAELEPTVIAQAIDRRAGAEAYDQVIVGYLLQIAHELRTEGSADLSALRRRTARLIGALSPETLRRLVEMGGDLAQRRAFVLDASQGMAVDAVIDIVRAAADASGQTISHGLVRMLSKLAAQAEFGESHARPLADAALREQVGELLNGWSLADPNPDAYTAVLHQLAVAPMVGPTGTLLHEPLPPDPLRIVQMALEIGDAGPMLDRAIDGALRGGRSAALLDALDAAPLASATLVAAIRGRLTTADALRLLAEAPATHHDTLERLRPSLGLAQYETLLDLLATADQRATRRRLLEFLSGATIDLAPAVAHRLRDPRWFVQRNMLVLLERLGRVPAGLSLTPWTTHDDVRVRHEAVRLQLRLPGQRHAAIVAALADAHPRVVHRGLVAVQDDCPAGVVARVAAIAADAGATDDLRQVAVRALARCGGPAALDVLLRLTDGGRTLLGRARLAPRSPVMLTALAALAAGWPGEARVQRLVRVAAASADDALRQAVHESPR